MPPALTARPAAAGAAATRLLQASANRRPLHHVRTAVLLACWLTSPAFAQTVGARPAPSWTQDEIVITGKRAGYGESNSSSATRTDTPLIETPQSVQVITRTLIEEQDRRTLGEALVNVSGVTPTRSEEVLFTSPNVRGFPAEIYLDGLPIYGATQAANDPTSLVGVERIDVVKGPTSTLYAGGTGTPLGGLINITSVRPTDRLGGTVALRGGSFGTIDPYADVNLPLGTGVTARVTGEYQRNGSWIDWLKGERWSLQPSLAAQLGSTTDLFVQGKFDHRNQLEYSGIPAVQALAGAIDRNAFPGAPIGQPRTTIDNQIATAQLRHAFTDALRLTVTGRYYHTKSRDNGSFVFPDFYPPDPETPTTYPILTIALVTAVSEAAVDANLLGRIDALRGRHELLAGVNYDHTDFKSQLGFDGVPVGVVDLANSNYTLAYGPRPALTVSQTDRYETVAAYAQDQATYGALHLLAALRYTRLRFREREQGTDLTFRRVSLRIGATLDLAPGVALYAAYATAFRGAFGMVSATTPKPETSRNIESGLKLALPAAGLAGTLALFDQTCRNVSTPDPNDIHFSIQTGAQRARGVEADLTWEPSPALSLLATYARTDAQVTEDTIIPVGDRLPRVPRDSGRIAARYRVLDGPAKGLAVGAGLTAFSAREITLPNSVNVPGYAAIDAQAAYDIGRFTVQASVVNLGGRRAFDPYQYLSFPVVIPNQPRSAYLTLKARF